MKIAIVGGGHGCYAAAVEMVEAGQVVYLPPGTFDSYPFAEAMAGAGNLAFRDSKPAAQTNTGLHSPTAPLTWVQRLKARFVIDTTLCPLCVGQLRVIAGITEPELITKILNHLRNQDPPRRAPEHVLLHSDPNDLFARG